MSASESIECDSSCSYQLGDKASRGSSGMMHGRSDLDQGELDPPIQIARRLDALMPVTLFIFDLHRFRKHV